MESVAAFLGFSSAKNMEATAGGETALPLSTGFPKRIFTEHWDTKPPCAVVVTIYALNSFDRLFRSVPQQSPDSERSVAIFEMDYDTISLYLQYMMHRGETVSTMDQATIAAMSDMVSAIDSVDPDSVVFNFECCSYCTDAGFPDNVTEKVLKLLQHNIQSGYMTMFGDFSAKALIASWDVSILGPAPFDRLGYPCSSSMILAFDSGKLLGCPSAQLQNVGKVHGGVNTAELHCMSNTIVFSLREDLQETLLKSPAYEIHVLTVATHIDNRAVNHGRLAVEDRRGHAGHVLLTYNNDAHGKVLVSAGHWIELGRMGADPERVFRAMRDQYGDKYALELRKEYDSAASEDLRDELIQKSSRQLIQSSVPCNYSKMKKAT